MLRAIRFKTMNKIVCCRVNAWKFQELAQTLYFNLKLNLASLGLVFGKVKWFFPPEISRRYPTINSYYSFYFKNLMNFNFLLNVWKTNFNFSVIKTKNFKHTLLTTSVVIDDS